MTEAPPKPKARKAGQPPEGDFSKGAMLWLPNMLRPSAGFSFTVPQRPPSLNEIDDLKKQAAKIRGTMYTAYKIAWEEVIRHYWVMQTGLGASEIVVAGKPRGYVPQIIRSPYLVRYMYLLKSRRWDPSNLHAAFEKFMLDALVDVGALPGDGAKWHRGSSYTWTDSESWGAVISIEQAEPDRPMDKRKAVGRHRTRRQARK